MQYLIKNLDELKTFGREITKHDSIFFLNGPIGVGKSTLVNSIISDFGFEYCGSPTFTLINYYENEKIKIIHADAYRDPEIMDEILILDHDLLFIEWPSEKMKKFFKKRCDLHFTFEKNCRIIERNRC
jgi:tRNA threonylcarbamoyl adenosine modification protein YjeE